tara:strand:- start:307 stop:513 length:207 start_codon:yes stop_codon:yes gene_type:complete
MEAQGIPTALVITEPFSAIVTSFAPTIGMEKYTAAVTVPHNVATSDDDELRKLAKFINPTIKECLTSQ